MEVEDGRFGALEALWVSTSLELPRGWELGGITYHGPQHQGPWVAFLYHVASAEVLGPEGIGPTPEVALTDLRDAIAAAVREGLLLDPGAK